MNIYLIRHGRQASKLCNLDVGLDDAGRKQAALAASRIKNYGIQAIYSSKLKRAIETAEIIKKYLENVNSADYGEISAFEGLNEIDFGKFNGILDSVNEKNNPEYFEEKRKLISDLRNPDGENGEDVYKRAYPVLMHIIEECQANGFERAAIVTHGGVIRSLCCGLLNMNFKDKLRFGVSLENCSITELVCNGIYAGFTLERFNDYAHLEGREELMRNTWIR